MISVSRPNRFIAICALITPLVLTASSAPGKSHESRPAAKQHFSAPSSAPRPAIHAPATSLSAQLLNPGFEQVDGAGFPLFWEMVYEAYADADASLAHSGTYSVRSAYRFGWGQTILTPCSPFQTFALTGYTAAEFAVEQARTRFAFFNGAGQWFRDINDYSPIAPDQPYGWFWTSAFVPRGAQSVFLGIGGRWLQSWLRFDDLALYTEQFSTARKPAGEAWKLNDNSHETSSGIVMQNGGSMCQRVATGRDNQAYFVAGQYSADAPAQLTACDQWLPRGGDETTITSCVTIPLAAGEGYFLADVPRPAGFCPGQSLVTLTAAAQGTLRAWNVTRGFAKVEPTVLSTGGGTPDRGLKLTAAWPEHLTTASIRILRAGSTVVTSLDAAQHGTSCRAEWDGGEETSGQYSAEFILVSESGIPIVLRRPFQIIRQNMIPAPPPCKRPEFVRGAWIFSVFDDADAAIEQVFQLAKADGYNMAMAHCRADQLGAVRAAAEKFRLPFIAQAIENRDIFDEYARRDYFSKADYLAQLHDINDEAATSPIFLGLYITDEPGTADALDLFRRANLAVAQDGRLGAGFAVLPDSVTTAELALTSAPVVLIDHYPFRASNPRNNTGALLASVGIANDYARAAAAMGRDMWYVNQSFTSFTGEPFRALPNSMHRGQLGAAVMSGCRGIIPFSYSSIGSMEGQRGPQLEAGRSLDEYAAFNSIMDRLGPVIMNLSLPVIDSCAPRPFAVTTALDKTGSMYVFILNGDDLSTQTLRIGLSPPPIAPLQELVSQRMLPVEGDATVPVQLAPGAWAMIATGLAQPSGYSFSSAPAPQLSTINLPVTHQFVLHRALGAPQPPLGLDFDSNTSRIAVSAGEYPLEASCPQIYILGADGSVVQTPGPLLYPSERTNFKPDQLVARSALLLGVRFFDTNDPGGQPVAEYTGHTGGAFDSAVSGNIFWLTLGDFGIRRLKKTTHGMKNVETGLSESGSYHEVFGPFADGSVTAIVKDVGLHNIKPGALNEPFHKVLGLRRVHETASLNENGMLAVPRFQNGVSLVQLDTNGEPAFLTNIASDAVEAGGCAWITANILAVNDGVYNVRFYNVETSGAARLLGTWRPDINEPFYLRNIAARGNRMAIGLHDGRVIVADTSSLITSSAVNSDWQMLE